MERSIEVEENQQKSDPTPVSNSSGSLIRIDAITIDLSGVMENHNVPMKCEHFSIRGYAAEMRKKDMSICLPFAFDGNQNKSEGQTSILPPLHVAKFRWWRCQNCLMEIGATSAAEEIGMVPDRCQSGFISSSSCSHLQSPSDVAMVLLDSQQTPHLDNFEGRKTDINSSTDGNRDEIRPSSFGYNRENEDELGQTPIISHENGAGNYVNQEIGHPRCDLTESNPFLIQESHADGPDALRLKSSGLVEFREPSCRSHAAADINLECMGSSSAEISQMGTMTYADGEHRIVSMPSETPKVAGRADEGINVKGQVATIPSVELEEHDNLSSESDGMLAKPSHHVQPRDNSSGLIRQKTRKVRLLTELLGSKGNAENDRIRTDSPSSVMPNVSAELESVSALRGHQGSLTKHFGGPKGKRKMPQDKDWKALELISPSKLSQKVFKGDAEIANMSSVVAESESEEDASAGVNLQAGVRSKCIQYRIDRNPLLSKKKKKQTQIEGVYSPVMPQQEVVTKTNQIKIGDAEKYCAADGGVFSQSAHEMFINRGMEPFFGSSVSPQQAETKSSLCKKKNKQVGEGHACFMSQGNSVLGECSVTRKDLNITETGPETVKLWSARDATAINGLDLSLNSYMVARGNEKRCIAQTGDGIDPLLPQLKGTPKDHHHQMKDIMHVGETSVSHKSTPDLFSRKGLLCDFNEKIANHRMPTPHEMQNLVPQGEDGSFPQQKQLDFCGSRNSENTVDVQEQGNDDIPMEIVELLARNQYERRRQEAERNYFLPEHTNDKRNAELMGFPRVHGNGVLRILHKKNQHMRKPPAGMGPIKQNPINCFSQIRGDHFNMGQLEGNSAFARFSAFSKGQDMQPGGVHISDSGSIRNGIPQNCKWKGDKVASRFSSTKMPILEAYNSFQNGSRQSKEAEYVRSSLLPNHMPFGLNSAQKYAIQSSNFEKHSQFPDTLCEGRMIGNLDLNLLNLNADNHEKQNRNFDSESVRRSAAEHPSVSKHEGIDLNAKASESLEPHSNETIPAMQLLSLMDSGKQSSSSFCLDGEPKFFGKPFFPCDHHPKVSLDGTSKILEKPLFPYDHYTKEFSGRGMGVYSDSSRHPPSAFYGKNHPLEKSRECSAAFPSVGTLASPFENDGNFKRGAGFTGRVPSKSEERGKALTQYRGRRLQKSVCTSGISHRSRDSNPIQDKQKGFSGASSSMVFPLQCHTIGGSTKCIDSEASCMNRNDICRVNRNPAEFSIPEAGNVYMISGKELKFGKKISSKGRSGINVDGRKRQRVTKLSAMKAHSQYHTS